MGQCVVCAKSAGPFNALHKKCLPSYHATQECLELKISESIQASFAKDKLIEMLESCKPSMSFSPSIFNSMVRKAWQKQAKTVIRQSPLNSGNAKAMLALASSLDIQPVDIEEHLILKLENLEYLEKLSLGLPLAKEFSHHGIDKQQSIVWVFTNVERQEQKTISSEKEWTIFQSVLNNLLNRSRYKKLDVKIEEKGELIITTENLYYIRNQVSKKIAYDEIYSVTPMKDGIRIQTSQPGAMPDTFITGDGRFTYELFKRVRQNQIN